MDAAEFSALALALSSDDLVTSMDAKRRLGDLLAPDSLLQLFETPASRTVAVDLLASAQATGDVNVYAVLGRKLQAALDSPQHAAELLAHDEDFSISRFIIASVANEQLSLASAMRGAMTSLLRTLDRMGDATNATTSAVVSILEATFQNETLLRLFDEDHIDCEANVSTCAFLANKTHLIQHLIRATCDAFGNDPLLLANYLVATGIVFRHSQSAAFAGESETSARELETRVDTSLQGSAEDILFAFVCRFVSTVLWKHEDNARTYAARWAAVAQRHYGECRDDSSDAVADVMIASLSSAPGAEVVSAAWNADAPSAYLKRLSPAARVSALQLLTAVAASKFVKADLLSAAVLRDAWMLRTANEPTVRVALWTLILEVLRNRPELSSVYAAISASFLPSAPADDNAGVREKQLDVARLLCRSESIPDGLKLKLEEFQRGGLYAPGYAGTASTIRR